jgi:hypothetical protein
LLGFSLAHQFPPMFSSMFCFVLPNVLFVCCYLGFF